MASNPWFDPSAIPRAEAAASAPAQVRSGAGDPVPSRQPSTSPGPPGPRDPAPAGDQAGNTVLVAYATGRLASGRRPEQVYADVLALGADRRIAAIAICTAAGTPWEVAESRMEAFEGIWASLGSGSAETAGGLLELYGYFDVEVELDHDQAVIAAYLRQAMAAVEYLPSGYANQLYRLLRTARLREALLSLEEIGGHRWADNLGFWLGMAEAAARLDSSEILDTEVAAARRRCESRARL